MDSKQLSTREQLTQFLLALCEHNSEERTLVAEALADSFVSMNEEIQELYEKLETVFTVLNGKINILEANRISPIEILLKEKLK